MSNKAKELLNNGVALAVVNGGKTELYYDSGIKRLLVLTSESESVLDGADVADKIVGKAAALLMVKGGVKNVYAEVLSKSAVAVFERYGVPYSFGTLTDRIINRRGDDTCPMEKTVACIDEPEAAYPALRSALAAMGVHVGDGNN